MAASPASPKLLSPTLTLRSAPLAASAAPRRAADAGGMGWQLQESSVRTVLAASAAQRPATSWGC